MYAYGIGVYAAWMRSLIVQKEFAVLKLAFVWFWCTQLPSLLRSIIKLILERNTIELRLNLLKLIGCFVGPWAYLISRKKQKRFYRQ